ncbi:MAG TPA: Ni/Fe hydrogenase subunit alpha [Anaerolineae bacterium]|nr:Ni/Fe hydrogenase subunit alpha [Anaerolineae bacterium]
MSRRITIDPITRLEGHGKIEVFLDESGDVERAFFQVPELRGFEKFCEGRPAEEMPRITPRICGVCPTAHHMASTKALDDLWSVEPPRTARLLRELVYNAFMVEDHYIHFFFLAGPDFVVGPQAPAAERNILGVIAKVGLEIAGQVIRVRKECREIIQTLGGKVIHPVFGLPGGVSRGMSEEERAKFAESAKFTVEFAQFALQLFDDVVLKNKAYVDLVLSDAFSHRTYYMGLVDDDDKVNFYDGHVRVVDPDGKEVARFAPREYVDYIREHVEPWSYITFPYLKRVGWKGFVDGADSGVYRVAPLARLNVADGMPTPLAQQAYERMYEILGGKPVHATLATHWARLVEALCGAERMVELLDDPEITSDHIRNVPTETPEEGVGIVEAPRGTLIHHYQTDERGILTGVSLIVATNHNAAPIAMSVEKAARGLIKGGEVSDGLLNMIEMAFRAYDPCHACATHALGQMPLIVEVRSADGELVDRIKRD